jgi:hypothetical protein
LLLLLLPLPLLLLLLLLPHSVWADKLDCWSSLLIAATSVVSSRFTELSSAIGTCAAVVVVLDVALSAVVISFTMKSSVCHARTLRYMLVCQANGERTDVYRQASRVNVNVGV